jgi:hypothetical protein
MAASDIDEHDLLPHRRRLLVNQRVRQIVLPTLRVAEK